MEDHEEPRQSNTNHTSSAEQKTRKQDNVMAVTSESDGVDKEITHNRTSTERSIGGQEVDNVALTNERASLAEEVDNDVPLTNESDCFPEEADGNQMVEASTENPVDGEKAMEDVAVFEISTVNREEADEIESLFEVDTVHDDSSNTEEFKDNAVSVGKTNKRTRKKRISKSDREVVKDFVAEKYSSKRKRTPSRKSLESKMSESMKWDRDDFNISDEVDSEEEDRKPTISKPAFKPSKSKSPGKVFVQTAGADDFEEISEQVFVFRNGKFVPLTAAPVVPAPAKNARVPVSKNTVIRKPIQNSRTGNNNVGRPLQSKQQNRPVINSSKTVSKISPNTTKNQSATKIDKSQTKNRERSKNDVVDIVIADIEVKQEIEDPEYEQIFMYEGDQDQDFLDEDDEMHQHKTYKCNHCNEKFSIPSALSAHRKKDHQEMQFHCTRCPMKFRVQFLLKRHMLRFHADEIADIEKEIAKGAPSMNIYACGECGDIFSTANQLKDHKKKKHTYRMESGHTCSHCGLTFSLPESLVFHSKAHAIRSAATAVSSTPKEGNYKMRCYMCSKTFHSHSIASEHMDKHHKLADKFVCNDATCNETFDVSEDLLKHFRKNHVKYAPRRYICDQCGKSFKDKRYHENHVLSHTGIKPFVCNVCGRSFSHKNVLQIHETTHRKREIACHICGSLFPNNHQFRSHYRTHSDARPYQCSVCGLRFKWRTGMSSHFKRLHTTDRPFKCEVCGRGYPSLGPLNTHMKVHAGIKPHICEVCGKSFLRRKNLRIHMRIHTGEKPYWCYLCERKFSQMTGLRSHTKTHGGEYSEEVHSRIYQSAHFKQWEDMRETEITVAEKYGDSLVQRWQVSQNSTVQNEDSGVQSQKSAVQSSTGDSNSVKVYTASVLKSKNQDSAWQDVRGAALKWIGAPNTKSSQTNDSNVIHVRMSQDKSPEVIYVAPNNRNMSDRQAQPTAERQLTQLQPLPAHTATGYQSYVEHHKGYIVPGVSGIYNANAMNW